MHELVILGHVGPMPITAYGLVLMGGAALALVLTVLLGKKHVGVDATLSMGMSAMAGAVIGGRLFYCLTMLEFILVDLGGAGFMVQPWERMALQYSTPRMLLGWLKTWAPAPIASKAAWRAAGKDLPASSSRRSRVPLSRP